MIDIHQLPTLNAIFNSISAVFLILGWFSIKNKDISRHRAYMVSALIFSAFFLTSYLYYHAHAGSTRYQGEGVLRILYFSILIPHTILATLIVPFILSAVYFAYRKRFDRHVRITKWLLPVWLYVNLTGVIIYLMLYVL